MATTLDYTGRLIDLLIFQNAQPQGDQKIYLGLGVGGEVTTGIQKMSQTFVILFLTETGSVPMLPLRGSRFITAIRLGKIIDEASLQSEFVLAAESVKRYMAITAEQEGWPDDEILTDIQLTNFSLNKATSTLIIYIQLTSQAGTTHDLFLPLSVVPR